MSTNIFSHDYPIGIRRYLGSDGSHVQHPPEIYPRSHKKSCRCHDYTMRHAPTGLHKDNPGFDRCGEDVHFSSSVHRLRHNVVGCQDRGGEWLDTEVRISLIIASCWK